MKTKERKECALIAIPETTLNKSSTAPVLNQISILLNSHTILWRHYFTLKSLLPQFPGTMEIDSKIKKIKIENNKKLTSQWSE